MDVLAKEAGVARATVYEHFRSKRAVLDELASSIARSVTMDESRAATSDPLVGLRDILGAVCRHWAEHEERMNGLRTLTALTGGDQAGEGIDEKQLRKLVESLAAAGQMRAHWTVDEATDALGALTSYATYERLRRAPRTPEEVEGVLAKLVVSIVSRGGAPAPNPTGPNATQSNTATSNGPPSSGPPSGPGAGPALTANSAAGVRSAASAG
jgi:AcrR family transcriptional regulator